MFHIAILFGGPSSERGVSINSARSVADHIDAAGSDTEFQLQFVYLTPDLRLVRADRWMLYQNTPDDFDYRVQNGEIAAEPLESLGSVLDSASFVFLAGHGTYFEDGFLQEKLEELSIPFLGTGSHAAARAFDKADALQLLNERGGPTRPSETLVCTKSEIESLSEQEFSDLKSKWAVSSVVMKPARSGSSIGVFACSRLEELHEKLKHYAQTHLIDSGSTEARFLIEPDRKQQGFSEFTTIVMQDAQGHPVALVPIGIHCEGVFTTRMKYLATRDAQLVAPCSSDSQIIEKIRVAAQQAFTDLELRDFARLDGWVNQEGDLIFSDFNVISGLEQNSLFFMQAAYAGFSHSEILRLLISNSCRRQRVSLPQHDSKADEEKTRLYVLFGGTTSERQVSVQSGTNVWLKLRGTGAWNAIPCQVTGKRVRELPYASALYHTVEDIDESINTLPSRSDNLQMLRVEIQERLGTPDDQLLPGPGAQWDLDQFLAKAKAENAFVFLALHGGSGENGEIQARLKETGIAFNCSGSTTSALCADKVVTNGFIDALALEGVGTARRVVLDWSYLQGRSAEWLKEKWEEWTAQIDCETPIIKPASDGCSTGVVHLRNSDEFLLYFDAICQRKLRIASSDFHFHRSHDSSGTHTPIEMPSSRPNRILLEEHIQTASIAVENMRLAWNNGPWVETTIGVYEKTPGRLSVMQPTVTVRSGAVLSLEEKFQAGMGVNFTPPPAKYVSKDAIKRARESVLRLARALELEGFARIDAFLNCESGALKIIEVNTLPGMTPATAIFHQCLAEQVLPVEFLNFAIQAGKARLHEPSVQEN